MKLIYVDSYEFSNLRALCLRRIRKHIWTYHLIFLCFRKVVWKTLEVIPQPGLWHLSTYWLCPFTHDPDWPCKLIRFSLLAARRLWSNPRLRRSRGPLSDLRRWREQLCVCGGSLQRLSARRRYRTKTLSQLSHQFSFGSYFHIGFCT